MKNTSRKPYIYKVTNLETGQYYIGSQCIGKTVGVNYFTSSTNKEFWEDFKTYGEEKYKIEIIKSFADPDECVHAENYMIRDHMLLKDGLCLNRFYCCGGEKVFSRVGTHHSEETRKKMSTSLKGIHRSEETRKKMRKPKKGRNKGTHHSEETKHKISKTLQGRPSSKKGIPRSEETKHKISEANKIKISIGDNTFNSLMDAAKYYNVGVGTIGYWLKTGNHNTVYIEK